MVKFIGFAVIIAGTTLMGFKYADGIKQRYDSLLYLKKILIMLRAEIDYNESAINEIFKELSQKTKGKWENFFQELYDKTVESYENSINVYWNEAVDKCLIACGYSKCDLDKIKELGENLGYLDKEMQMKNIDYTLDYIDIESNELCADMDKNMKMWRMLGALAGIFIVIIFC